MRSSSQIQSPDVVVVGAGHAGLEAAAAAATMGCATLLITQSLAHIGTLSCNPAIGGVGKGQLVKEVDALGGVMGLLADKACIHYRQLNQSRGAAVRSTRMQVDMAVYQQEAQAYLRALPNLAIMEDEVVDVYLEERKVKAVTTAGHGFVQARAVVFTVGTFFHGLIHIGRTKIRGGRLGDGSSDQLPDRLQALGLSFGRFKTGTTPRLKGRSIDFSRLTEQPGDPAFIPFSSRSPSRPPLDQVSCYLGHTNPQTHRIIRDHLNQSALYGGDITGTGVRYCPSVEDKIVKFPGRDSHHVFVEPEGLSTDRYYPNGLSNSLPEAIQEQLVHSVSGLEKAEIVQPGYGIEHDYLLPTQLKRTLECQACGGLYFAGQINGTTGYEEAAAQGLLAGINAALQVQDRPPFILERSQAYLGVLVDDLVTKGTNEPYRMFTSRVEYRLVIREDNADERLAPLGHQVGLVSGEVYEHFQAKMARIDAERARLEQCRVSDPAMLHDLLGGTAEVGGKSFSLHALLKRPEIHYDHLARVDQASALISHDLRQAVEVRVKYEGYIKRQQEEIEKALDLEQYKIPAGFQYQGLPGLSLEVVEKLSARQPETLGQASRISGITPAAISLILLHLRKK